MTRPSNRELRVLSHMETGGFRAPSDYTDIGERTFAGMEKKGWIVADNAGFRATPKGLKVHETELMHGRWKR